MLEYQLIRSKRRKTLGLQVKHGQVTVRAPYHVSSTFIDTLIQEKSSWLRAKIIAQQGNVDFCDYSQGSDLLFLGEQVKLNINCAKQASVFICDELGTESALNHRNSIQRQLNVVVSDRIQSRLIGEVAKAKQVKKQLELFFKTEAEKLIAERLTLISQQTSLIPTKTNIRQYRARWGSCNNRGEVSLNYLLMMTPLFVIDYVIVHELCHLVHLNHSQSFWQLVDKHFPDYKLAKQWLHDNQSQLYWKTP